MLTFTAIFVIMLLSVANRLASTNTRNGPDL